MLAIARSLMSRPKLILLDEPSSGLALVLLIIFLPKGIYGSLQEFFQQKKK